MKLCIDAGRCPMEDRPARRINRRAVRLVGALALSSLLLCGVSCTRNEMETPGETSKDTTRETTRETTRDTTGETTRDTTAGTSHDTAKPLDPDAGTVDPNAGTAGDPPAAPDTSRRRILPGLPY